MMLHMSTQPAHRQSPALALRDSACHDEDREGRGEGAMRAGEFCCVCYNDPCCPGHFAFHLFGSDADAPMS